MATNRLATVTALWALVAVIATGWAFAHDAPGGGHPAPAERIDPSRVYPFAVVAAGGGHFHALQVMPGEKRIFAGTHLGLFVSHDRGLTWRLADARFSGVDVHALVRDPGTGSLYAATHGLGLLVSHDGGARWEDASRGLPGRDLHALALDSREPRGLYVWAIGQGLFVRRSGSTAWQRIAGPDVLTAVDGLAVHPRDVERLYAGTARGVWISRDGGHRWELPPGGLHARTAAVVVVPSRPDTILAATFDGVFAGDHDGIDWRQIEPVPSWWGPVVGFAFVETRLQTIFAVAHEGPVVTRPLDGGPWEPLARIRDAADASASRRGEGTARAIGASPSMRACSP